MLSSEVKRKICRLVADYGASTKKKISKAECIRFVGSNIEDELFDKKGRLKISSPVVYDFIAEMYKIIYN